MKRLLAVAVLLTLASQSSAMGVLELPTLHFPQPEAPTQDCTTPLKTCE